MRHDRKTYSWQENCPAEPAEEPVWLIELLTTPPTQATRNGNGRSTRLGVSGMRERALLVGGELSIFSEPGDGTTIELTMGAT